MPGGLVVEVFFQFLAGPEKWQTLGADFDLFASTGIAPRIACIFLDFKAAEASYLYTVASQEGFFHTVYKCIDYQSRLIGRNTRLFSKGFYKLTFVHAVPEKKEMKNAV